MALFEMTVVVHMHLDDEVHHAFVAGLPFEAVSSESGGVVLLDMEVGAPSAVEAARIVYDNLKGAPFAVLRFDFDLVTASGIADRVGVSRESVRQWSIGGRRDQFPMPYANIGGQRVWAWADVYNWLLGQPGLASFDAEVAPLPVQVVERFNGIFAKRRSLHSDGWKPVEMTGVGVFEAQIRVESTSVRYARPLGAL